MKLDVAIIGGDPAGSTTGSYLRKAGEDENVMILDRQKFARDRVGESRLPLIFRILDQTGRWDKVEPASFPIYVSSAHRWGTKPEHWASNSFSATCVRTTPAGLGANCSGFGLSLTRTNPAMSLYQGASQIGGLAVQ